MHRNISGPVSALAIVAALFSTHAIAQTLPDVAPPPPIKHSPVNPHRYEDGSLRRGLRNEVMTQNWSGYALANFQTAVSAYTQTRASWIVPQVSYVPLSGNSANWEYSSSWAGIGGYCENSSCTAVDNTLIQLGTDADVSSTGATYYVAWYEMLPNYAIPLPNPIGPGDYIVASLVCVANCSASKVQTWRLGMSDIAAKNSGRSSWNWSKNFQYQTTMLSAEWIEEAPWLNTIVPLGNYATLGVGSIYVNNVTATLQLNTNGIAMEDPWGQTSNPAAPLRGSAFSACWGSGTTLTPCTTQPINPPK